MRRNPLRRIAGSVLLATLAGLTGCTNYYYYGRTAPVMAVPAGGPPVVVQPGPVCEVPAASQAVVTSGESCAPISSGSALSSLDSGSQKIVSQPQGALRSAPAGSKYAWRRPEPESMATTRIEGGIDEATTR